MPKNTKKFKQDPATAIKSFSRNLLGLKFMQRAKKEVDKVEETNDNETSFETSLCQNSTEKQKYIINHSYQLFDRLKFGRLSYQGMNPDIETIMSQNNQNETSSQSLKRSAPSSEESSSDNEIDNLDTEEENEDEEEDILERIQ